jgi:hypothetical protein
MMLIQLSQLLLMLRDTCVPSCRFREERGSGRRKMVSSYLTSSTYPQLKRLPRLMCLSVAYSRMEEPSKPPKRSPLPATIPASDQLPAQERHEDTPISLDIDMTSNPMHVAVYPYLFIRHISSLINFDIPILLEVLQQPNRFPLMDALYCIEIPRR